MKHIYRLIIILLIVIQPGCKKFLEEKTFANLSETIFPKTEGDLRVLCNGLYGLFEVNEHYGRSYIIISDVFSDEISTIALNGPRYEMENFLITPGNTEVAQFWTRNYIVISRANVIIQKAPLIGLAEEKIRPFVAEARFIRAFCYFELTRFFGDIPLISTQPTVLDSLLALQPSRSAQSDVYRQIVEDLQYAEQYLKKEAEIPGTYKGLATSGAATSLLAKVYLTRGYQSFKEAEDFQNAAAACERVMNSRQYNLFPNYKDVFDITKENGIEHIFSIQYDRAPNRSSGITGFLVPPQVYPFAFGVFPAERKFYDRFPNEDANRKDFAFFDQGVGIRGTPYNFLSTAVSNPFCAKYRDDELANIGFNDRCNYLILRFADLLLMHSEALNRVNPADPNKYIGIDSVRKRAQVALLPRGLDQNAFEDAILDERHWELCFEGQRRHDLIRMGKLVEVMTALGKTNVREYHKFLPVPQTEIDLNPKLLPQNPGYDN